MKDYSQEHAVSTGETPSETEGLNSSNVEGGNCQNNFDSINGADLRLVLHNEPTRLELRHALQNGHIIKDVYVEATASAVNRLLDEGRSDIEVIQVPVDSEEKQRFLNNWALANA